MSQVVLAVNVEIGAVNHVRRALGPILTTGVVLCSAAVVVANPVLTQPRDISVPSVQLSVGNAASQSTLEKSLVDAIGADSHDQAGPVSVLKQLFSTPSADAGLPAGEAVSEAVVVHNSAVLPPSSPAASPSQGQTPPAPGLDALANLLQPALAGPREVATQMAPELRQALAAANADAGYVGQQAIVAAIAAAGLVGTEPALVTQALTALAKGDVAAAVTKVVEAAATPLRPEPVVLESVRTLAAVVPDTATPVPSVAAAVAAPAVAAEPAVTPKPGGASRTTLQAASAIPADTPAPQASANGGTDLTNGNKVVPQKLAAVADQLGSNFAVPDRLSSAVADFGDALRKLAGRLTGAGTESQSHAAQ